MEPVIGSLPGDVVHVHVDPQLGDCLQVAGIAKRPHVDGICTAKQAHASATKYQDICRPHTLTDIPSPAVPTVYIKLTSLEAGLRTGVTANSRARNDYMQ